MKIMWPLALLCLVFSEAQAESILQTTAASMTQGATWNPDASRVIQLSTTPRVFLYEGFLTPEECEYLSLSGKQKIVPFPGSKPLGTATYLRKYQDKMVWQIEDRITAWLFPPRERPEDLKVMRYNEGQVYDVHYAFHNDPSNAGQYRGGRVATLMLFLSNVTTGGEMVFPQASLDGASIEWMRSTLAAPSPCNSKGLAVRPVMGSALLLYHMTPGGTPVPEAKYVECPVVVGEKWMAVKWVSLQKYMLRKDLSVCEDNHENCEMWARAGECEKNPKYMVGVPGWYGTCRKACKACTPKA